MKDLNDKATLDLIDKPRCGRPPTGKAKSQAQIQREYRQRKAEQGVPALGQALSGFHVMHLGKGCRIWRKFFSCPPLSWEGAQSAYRGLVLAAEQCDTGDKFRIDPASPDHP
ncbi:hypothetical protein D3C85_1290470 [compost metagenome]